MKYNQIISISLFNGFTLLIFASLLASCQKNNIKNYGHFSVIDKQASRSIASTESKQLTSFKKYFDLKQVYIYCKINSVHKKNCFKNNLNKIITNYENKHGPLPQKDKNIIENHYKTVQIKVDNITGQIVSKVTPHILKLVKEREDFCEKNSTYYLKKCLNQYVESDTMKVLNKYQKHNKNINGHEYLYLKKHIVQKFKIKLSKSFKTLNSKEKKS